MCGVPFDDLLLPHVAPKHIKFMFEKDISEKRQRRSNYYLVHIAVVNALLESLFVKAVCCSNANRKVLTMEEMGKILKVSVEALQIAVDYMAHKQMDNDEMEYALYRMFGDSDSPFDDDQMESGECAFALMFF